MASDEGWSTDQYEEARRLCENATAASLDDDDALTSIWHQLTAARVRRTAHVHRDKASTYLSAWERGDTLVALASRANFPPVLIARLVLEAGGVPKKAVGDLVRHTDKIADERLRRDVIECVRVDEHYSPRNDAARHKIGIDYEQRLADRLDQCDVPFEHEDDLRAKGFAKTPDALLAIPLGFLSRGRLRVVNWIDSKALFGSAALYHADHRQQLLAYVNRFGPGAVIYWFGFANELQSLDVDILLLSRWPDPGSLFWPDATPVDS